MPELLVDFITSLDGYASGGGLARLLGLEGPEYLAYRPSLIEHPPPAS
jgi:hypothetical protein